MGTSAPGVVESIGVSAGVPRVEVALIGAIVIVALVLLSIRSLRRVEHRRRRATSIPFERPVNASRPSGRDTTPGPSAPRSSARTQQMAPTFAASRKVDPPKGAVPTGAKVAAVAQVRVTTPPPTGPPAAVRPPPRPGSRPRTAVPANLPPLAPAPPAR